MDKKDLRQVSNDDFEVFAKKYIKKYRRNILKDDPTDNRVLVGYYMKGDIKVKFYDEVPSWFSRQQMYWIHGWEWISV